MARARRSPSKTAPPSILHVMFDQMGALSLPCYGHPLVKAPNLRALADSGVVFEQAYCNAPLCSPSRHAMMTGQLPSRIGVYDNAAELSSTIPTFAHYLRRAGYRTCLSGKMDFSGADQLHGYEERLTTDLSPSDFGWTPNWDEPARLYDWFHSLQNVVEAGPCDHSLTMTYDEEATHRAIRWLHDRARGGDDRPFLLTLAYMHPHDPYLAPRKFWEAYEGVEIDPPAVPRIPLARRSPAERRLYELYDRDEYRITAAHLRAARRAYYAMIDYVDDQLGRVLEALRRTGAAEDTVVVVTSDHGDMLGERGLWYKMTFFDRAVRVPLLLQAPGRLAPLRVGAPVSLVDLLPTLMDIAGSRFAPAIALDGQSLWPAATGGGKAPGAVFGEYLAEGTAEPIFMIRRGSFKYVASPGDPPMLFDLSRDPLELDNLAGTPAMVDIETEFAAERAARWDAAAIRRRVVESQRARRVVHEALMRGRLHAWDFQPRSDATKEYYRNYGHPDGERALRLPPAGPPPRPRR
jgi:choline-sulfatase